MFKTTVNFYFGNVSYYENYLCLEASEFVNFDVYAFDELLQKKIELYGERKIGYLSNRINTFSFDPIIFFERKTVILQHFKWLIIKSMREVDKLESSYIKKICPIPCRYIS